MKVIFTRYLYDKSKVGSSLEHAIQMINYEDALFWAYELYYSGFQEEVIQLLLEIVENKYAKHPKLCDFIKKKADLKEDATVIATSIKNILLKNPDKEETKKPRFIVIKEEQILQYKTKEPNTDLLWKYLQMVCEKDLYVPPFCNPSSSAIDVCDREKCKENGSIDDQTKKIKNKTDEMLLLFREKWLYYGSFSPVWRDRIFQNGGKIDNRSKKVIFMKEEDMEAFYDKYNYEPDEQPLSLQKKCMGIV